MLYRHLHNLPVCRQVRLILGDQLNAGHSWYRQSDDTVMYVIAELRQETDYCVHHLQKVLAFFASMHNFAHALADAGHQVLYVTLDDTTAYSDLSKLLDAVMTKSQAESCSWQQPDEYRVAQQLATWGTAQAFPVEVVSSEHFLLEMDQLSHWFEPGKAPVMEYFYRDMRRQFCVLMEAGKPVGGKWNFDKENRQRLPRQAQLPAPLLFANDVSVIKQRISHHQLTTMGRHSGDSLLWPCSRRQARELLQFFIQHCLPYFGRYQDALGCGRETEQEWSVYHSRLSFSLNSKMLHPMEVIEQAVSAWYLRPDEISLAQVEGFVRQILGWREYVRGIYWSNMPAYADKNALDHQRELPGFYWDGQTKMACMAAAIGQSLDYAYAHHIQRLMITGNFALLAGIHPDQVDAWYLGIYIDALEWVEMPNTRGMSQFADGGLLATKPYISSGNYIASMGHYCGDCHYEVKRKSGDRACPFNVLFWHFLHRHQTCLERSPRMQMMYRNWWSKSAQEQDVILAQAQEYLNQLDTL